MTSSWAEVQKSARAARAPSPTASYQEIYENLEVKEHLKDVELTGKIIGITVLIELLDLAGREKLAPYPVHSVLQY